LDLGEEISTARLACEQARSGRQCTDRGGAPCRSRARRAPRSTRRVETCQGRRRRRRRRCCCWASVCKHGNGGGSGGGGSLGARLGRLGVGRRAGGTADGARACSDAACGGSADCAGRRSRRPGGGVVAVVVGHAGGWRG
jgi:hypothetical protein